MTFPSADVNLDIQLFFSQVRVERYIFESLNENELSREVVHSWKETLLKRTIRLSSSACKTVM